MTWEFALSIIGICYLTGRLFAVLDWIEDRSGRCDEF